MKKTAVILAALLAGGCSARAGGPGNPTRLDSVLVNVDGVDHKIAMEKPEMVQDLDQLHGACITPDLKHARLLRKGKDCDDGWVAVKGNTAR